MTLKEEGKSQHFGVKHKVKSRENTFNSLALGMLLDLYDDAEARAVCSAKWHAHKLADRKRHFPKIVKGAVDMIRSI
jgi:hypothetical protein